MTTSRSRAPAEALWRRAVTPEGINDELGPVLKMTYPKSNGEIDRLLVSFEGPPEAT